MIRGLLYQALGCVDSFVRAAVGFIVLLVITCLGIGLFLVLCAVLDCLVWLDQNVLLPLINRILG